MTWALGVKGGGVRESLLIQPLISLLVLQLPVKPLQSLFQIINLGFQRFELQHRLPLFYQSSVVWELSHMRLTFGLFLRVFNLGCDRLVEAKDVF